MGGVTTYLFIYLFVYLCIHIYICTLCIWKRVILSDSIVSSAWKEVALYAGGWGHAMGLMSSHVPPYQSLPLLLHLLPLDCHSSPEFGQRSPALIKIFNFQRKRQRESCCEGWRTAQCSGCSIDSLVMLQSELRAKVLVVFCTTLSNAALCVIVRESGGSPP